MGRATGNSASEGFDTASTDAADRFTGRSSHEVPEIIFRRNGASRGCLELHGYVVRGRYDSLHGVPPAPDLSPPRL